MLTMNDTIKKFEAAARKCQRMIDAMATAEVSHASSAVDAEGPILRAINRLHGLANRTVGEPGQIERLGVISGLITRRIAAHEAMSARIAEARSVRMRQLTIEAARLANRRPY